MLRCRNPEMGKAACALALRWPGNRLVMESHTPERGSRTPHLPWKLFFYGPGIRELI